jgi:hypothetical protein
LMKRPASENRLITALMCVLYIAVGYMILPVGDVALYCIRQDAQKIGGIMLAVFAAFPAAGFVVMDRAIGYERPRTFAIMAAGSAAGLVLRGLLLLFGVV